MHALNLADIVAGAWQLFWGRRRVWFDLALIPLIWSMLLDMTLLPRPADMAALSGPDGSANPEAGAAAFGFLASALLYLVLSMMVWTMFASAWMRACLGEQPASARPPGLYWSSYDSGVLGAAVRLTLILFAGFAVVMLVLGPSLLGQGLNAGSAMSVAIVALFGVAPMLARSSLILPAASVGQPAAIVDSWRQSSGNALRLLVLLLSLVVVAYLVGFLVAIVLADILRGLFGTPLTIGPRLVLVLVVNLTSFAASAVILAALALCYRRLGGPRLRPVAAEQDDG